jgi:histone-lysine N-methyltransferase SETMAR
MNNEVHVQPVLLLKSFKIVSQVVHGSLPLMGKAVNAISCMRFAVREKRAELLDNAIILHDNATSHTADTVRRCLQRWGWEILQHPPYSPDLSPCDFDLIPKVKKPLRGKRFANKQDIFTAFR